MIVYQLFILCCLLVFLGIVLRNLFDLRPLPLKMMRMGPMVSVLVPARNEERNIVPCVTSLLRQDYGNYEVVVLDDHSTDRTRALVDALVAESGGRLRILRGKELPDGWHGKAWACQQLGEAATGELLLFTDADTFHHQDSLRRAVAAIEDSGAGLLTLTPSQSMGSFWEWTIIPLVYHILLAYLPVRMVPASRSPAFCYAIGQYLLFRRDTWRSLGGHGAVRNNLIEDVGFCKAVKRSGGKVAVYDGTDVVICRMYSGPGEIWSGFSKNIFAGLGRSAPLLFTILLLMALFYLVPCGFLASAIAGGNLTPVEFWLPAAQVAVAVLTRAIVALKFRQPLWPALLHAPATLVLLLITLNSYRLSTFGRGPEWKGRNYRF